SHAHVHHPSPHSFPTRRSSDLYSFQQVPLGARTSQALNSISSVPGLIEFRAPKSATRNFAPKVGFAYSPNYNSGMLGRLFGSNGDRKSTRLNSSHSQISYAVFC